MSDDSLILALEAATKEPSWALLRGERLLAEWHGSGEEAHSLTLLAALDALLGAEKLSLAEIEGIAVTRGPGAFTSVRIALATALGLAFPRALPIYALNTLEVLAFGAGQELPHDALVLSLLDARKRECYGALYRTRAEAAPVQLIAPGLHSADSWLQTARDAADGARLHLSGSGAAAYAATLPAAEDWQLLPGFDAPRARDLGLLVRRYQAANRPFESPVPLYLRLPEAVINAGAAHGPATRGPFP